MPGAPGVAAHLSLTELQGSMDSSLAATRPWPGPVSLFRYTMGVLPAPGGGLGVGVGWGWGGGGGEEAWETGLACPEV